MWRHPRHAELTGRAPAAAPKPSGETLATLVRRGPDGVEQRLRVALDQYEGHPYVSVRLWQGGRPTKKGCSLRMTELPVIISALQEALDRADPEPAREAPRRGRERKVEPRRDWDRDGVAGKPAVNLGDQGAY